MEVVVGLGAAHLLARHVVLAETQRLIEVARLAVLGALQEELPGIAVLVVDADLVGVSWVVAFEAWHYRDWDC